jgi:mannose-6-phosphate isomerase
MNQIPLYPLRFAPIYQYRLWGGRRLTSLEFLPSGAIADSPEQRWNAPDLEYASP